MDFDKLIPGHLAPAAPGEYIAVCSAGDYRADGRISRRDLLPTAHLLL